MQSKKMNLDDLMTDTDSYLRKLQYSDQTIAMYRSAWNHLAEFMIETDTVHYSAYTGEAFAYSMIEKHNGYGNLSQYEKYIIQCVNVLTEFLETGTVKFRRRKIFRSLTGSIGSLMKDYVTHKMNLGISEETADSYRYHLGTFLIYLNDHNIETVEGITPKIIIEYAATTVFASQNVQHNNLCILKSFLKYLYDTGKLKKEISHTVPKSKRVQQPKLPSTYSREEILSIEAAVDRGNPKGKRDYAMLLLTARLGMRASDVCELKFQEIDWEHNRISIIQGKTREPLELPLLPEVGEAIIDYIRYGRPVSELPYIFLHVNSPYDRLNRSTLHSIVCQYMRQAGVTFEKKRHHGPHALRHSLAALLLEKKTPLPVISEVLGHRNTESTRYYLRIDINSMKQCMLDVPPVNPHFYRKDGDTDV